MVILGHNLGNSQVSVYRTFGPTLVYDNKLQKAYTRSFVLRKAKGLGSQTSFFSPVLCPKDKYNLLSYQLFFSSPEPKAHR